MDELVKRLRNLRICIQQSGSLEDFPMLKEASDAIEELQKAVLRLEDESGILDELPMYQQPVGWIPVTERLPKVRTWVLCYCRANSFDVFRMTDEGHWQYGNRSIYMKGYVTHWMPLPEPPKEET